MKNFKSLRNQLWENSNRSSGFAGNSRPKGAADSAKHLAERARILGPAASIVDIYESRIASKLIEGKQLQEGVFDADILKAIFVIGGSGSGKSFISQSMFAGRNLKTVNPDEPFERFAKQQKLDLGDPEVMQSDYVQNILRPKAKSLTKKRYEHYIENRLGLIIDGTGRDARKIMDQKKALEKIGYDTYMVFVDVSLEQALKNNASRGRAVPEDIVREAHDSVRKNLPLFKAAFGRGFVTIENDRMVSPEVFTKVIKVKLIKIASKVMSKSIKNPVGRQWVDVMSGAAKQLVKIKTAATNRKEKDPAQRFRLSAVTESKEAKPPAIQLAEAQSISIESAATNLYQGVVSGDSINLSMSKLMENLNHYRINCTIAEQYENQLQDGVISHYREMGVDCKVARTNGGGFVIQRDKVHVFVECVGNNIFEVTPLTENAESVRGSYIDISYALKNL